ncbi:hypothetical protein N474_20450 [Pseudoalteromonas luteoviolacea CPMOR-2]|uniref:Uncharacterized protein n=1 Tax=Pseudoalteromonas luteoviolacea DSM 6061 TaxID=1365250 RepID=A0A166YYG3_9GAMM|nr:hypothetical protein [Pseudoalteromonas luteoviolacea]KZN43635.1 hypothetical protein N475_08680 [Pseudoalteromonas luteoviolacea DSM 6061]KZN53706.1 hypothetical protein N474_20450 [Pseudoalteromonas luteoviolacea CPMOR-2]MBE0386481.1 hypothetical protein [Pseudoalteromonas luteoviolacea DSM 6061]
MIDIKKVVYNCLAIWLVCVCTMAHGHALKETTATITVRSGQLDILVNANFAHWLSTLHSHEAWLLGDTELVLLANQTDKHKAKQLKEMIVQRTGVAVNGHKLKCSVNQFPSNLSELQKAHHTRSYFRLGCIAPNSQINSVALSLPKSLGRIYVSLVRPKQQVIGAGEKAMFNL